MRFQLLRLLLLTALTIFIQLPTYAYDTLPRPVTICSGANIIIKGDAISTSPDAYRWEFYQNGIWTAAPGTNNGMDYLATPLFNPTNQNIIYNLRRVMIKSNVSDLDSYYIVTVQPILPITGNILTQPLVSSFCVSGTPTAIIGDTPSSGTLVIMYLWQSSADGVNFNYIDGATAKDYTPGEITSSTFYRRIAVSGGCGVSSVSNVILMTILPPVLKPELNQTAVVICTGSSATLSVKNPIAGITYNWYSTASGGTSLGSGQSWVTPKMMVKTQYYLEAQNKEGCTYTARQPVEVDLWPVLAAPVVTVDQTTFHTVTFKWEGISGATGYMISEDKGITYQTPSTGATGLSHTITGLQSSQPITIQVKALGLLTCQDSGNAVSVTANTETEYDGIFVPNAFTPNKDGKNDIVYVRSQMVKTMRFYIYSQWGAQIFYSSDISNGWDGSFRGVDQPVGVYMYTLTATMNNGQEINKKGSITLIR